MRKEIFQEIKIPGGVSVEIEGGSIIVKGAEGENKRTFNTLGLEFKKENDKIILGSKKATKKNKKIINSIAAHIRNMVKGAQKKFEYKLKICFSHFPFTVSISGDKAEIKNFLGEKVPRTLILPKEVEIKTDKENITIFSKDKELAGKVAADFERVTKVREKDKRIFQDGIYIIEKAGRKI